MERLPIFSTYSQNENRITSSLLAVLARVDLRLVERIIEICSSYPDFELVQIRNQARTRTGDSVPDGSIRADAHVLLELKVVPGALAHSQLLRHARQLDEHAARRILLAITPDAQEPASVAEVNVELGALATRPVVVWCTYDHLHGAIETVLGDVPEEVSGRDRFLLRELQALIENERLLDVVETVIVAAGRTAWGEYAAYGLYICQAGRSFRPVSHMGFYADKAIQASVPKVLGWIDIETTDHVAEVVGPVDDGIADQFHARYDHMVVDGRDRPDGAFRAAVLTPPGDDSTITLTHPIANAHRDKNGKLSAWTMGQRYVVTDRLLEQPTPVDTDGLA